MTALRAGDITKLSAAISNDLQAPALALFPALEKTLTAGNDLGALAGLVSGSGPTCFFLARDAPHATALAAALSGAGVCRSVKTATGPASGAALVTRAERRGAPHSAQPDLARVSSNQRSSRPLTSDSSDLMSCIRLVSPW